MKKCNKCKKRRNNSMFYKETTNICKECTIATIRSGQTEKMAYIKAEARRRGCAITGDKTGTLTWHHIDPETKMFNIGRPNNRRWEVIKAEMEKCVVLENGIHVKLHNVLRGCEITKPTGAFIEFMNKYYPSYPIKIKGE